MYNKSMAYFKMNQTQKNHINEMLSELRRAAINEGNNFDLYNDEHEGKSLELYKAFWCNRNGIELLNNELSDYCLKATDIEMIEAIQLCIEQFNHHENEELTDTVIDDTMNQIFDNFIGYYNLIQCGDISPHVYFKLDAALRQALTEYKKNI